MLKAMKTYRAINVTGWLIVALCLFALPNSIPAENASPVEIKERIGHQIPGPTIEDIEDANWRIRLFLDEKVPGRNVSCYVTPTGTGHVLIWINGRIPEVTPEIRAEVESIVDEHLSKPRKGTGRAAQSDALRIEELNAPGVMGRLGIPLGIVVMVDADIVEESQMEVKSLDGVLALSVVRVDDKELPSPVVIRFSWLATVEAKKLAGRVRLVGYETGAFVGIPSTSFVFVPAVTSQDFHFESSFVVLKSIQETEE